MCLEAATGKTRNKEICNRPFARYWFNQRRLDNVRKHYIDDIKRYAALKKSFFRSIIHRLCLPLPCPTSNTAFYWPTRCLGQAAAIDPPRDQVTDILRTLSLASVYPGTWSLHIYLIIWDPAPRSGHSPTNSAKATLSVILEPH